MKASVQALKMPPARINVVGTSGSGKSTFSKKLSAILDAPYVELDKLFWGPDWQQPSDDVFFARVKQALAQDTWILDGNYTRTIPIKWERVDVVIWLDYSFATTVLQAIKRAAHRSWTREELWEGTGNRESFLKSFFSKESIIWWTITTYWGVRKRYETFFADPRFSKIRFVRLRDHRAADRFLQSLQETDI